MRLGPVCTLRLRFCGLPYSNLTTTTRTAFKAYCRSLTFDMSGLLPLRLLSQPEVPQSRRSSRLSRSASFRRQSTVYSSTATSDRTLTKQRIAVPIMTQANRPREKRDWKLVMNVARDLYIAEQYQDCYTYCISVLELTRGLVCLSFHLPMR